MIVRYYVSFNAGERLYHRVHGRLQPLGCADQLAGPESCMCGYFAHTFAADDPTLHQLRMMARSLQLDWTERREHVYSVDELRAAPLLEFSLSRSPRELGYPYEGQYDFATGCPHCHTGARQVGPIRVNPPFSDSSAGLPRTGVVCQTIDFDYLVRGELHAALASATLPGLKLMEARSKLDEPTGWWQLVAEDTMPRMSPATRGLTRGKDRRGRPLPTCVHCDRANYYHSADEPLQIVYRRRDIGAGPLPDAAFTWEGFGETGPECRSVIARPRLLVSPRVLDIFRKLKVRGPVYAPVQIGDD